MAVAGDVMTQVLVIFKGTCSEFWRTMGRGGCESFEERCLPPAAASEGKMQEKPLVLEHRVQ